MSRKIIIALLFVFILSACGSNSETIQQTSTSIPSPTAIYTLTPVVTAFPTSELSSYYGEPEPIQIILDNKTYDSQIGTTSWIIEVYPDGTTVTEIGDAFAIITPIEPIIMTSNPSFTLKFPILINPTELWYVVYKVAEEELNSQDTTHGALRWNPDYATQTYHEQTNLPLIAEQELNLSIESGFYVLEVHAGWGGTSTHPKLEADFGFLLEVQE